MSGLEQEPATPLVVQGGRCSNGRAAATEAGRTVTEDGGPEVSESGEAKGSATSKSQEELGELDVRSGRNVSFSLICWAGAYSPGRLATGQLGVCVHVPETCVFLLEWG